MYEEQLNYKQRMYFYNAYNELFEKLYKECDKQLILTGGMYRNDLYLKDLDCLLICEEKDNKKYFNKIRDFFFKGF